MTQLLTSPTGLAGLPLKNRIVMAPMTRSRAEGNIPNELMTEYYRQRNGAGLVITEGVAPAPEALGYARIAGLFTDAQQAAWANIFRAVTEGGARIFVQLMHTGRIGHPANLPEGARLLAPSAVTAAGEIWTDAQGMQPHPLPEAMDADDLRRVREAFVDAARRAIAAGADGVELHGANGYLLAQFLNPRSNRREDGYGGSAGNRRRFVLEVVDATVAAIGAGRVGLRLSPFNAFNDLEANYPGEVEEFLALVDALQSRGLAYLHLAGGTVPAELLPEVRARHRGSLILNGGFDAARAEQALATGQADLVAFGRPFVANPDLVERVARRAPLAEFDPDTLYTPGAKGYTDYPALAEAALA